MDFRNRYITAQINITGKNPRVFYINTDSKGKIQTDKPQLFMDVKMEMMGFDGGRAYIRIFGLSQETMKACTVINQQSAVYFGNTITVSVNNTVLFTGEIIRSVPNYSEAPNLSLDIECFTSKNGLKNRTESVKKPYVYPVIPFNYSAKTIKDALRYIAVELCGYDNKVHDVFEDERAQGRNYSFDGMSCLYLRSDEPLPYRLYMVGTPKENLDSFCKNFGIQYSIRHINKSQELFFWPIGQMIPASGAGATFFEISTEKGNLFGYPTATMTGCKLKCEFNPNMQVGNSITLKTIVPGLSKKYVISKLEGYISTREGKWEADLEGTLYAEPK